MSVTLSLVNNDLQWEIWEVGSSHARMGDWDRIVGVYANKKNAEKYLRRYAKKLRKLYGEEVYINIVA